jgi:hypothetical protein
MGVYHKTICIDVVVGDNRSESMKAIALAIDVAIDNALRSIEEVICAKVELVSVNIKEIWPLYPSAASDTGPANNFCYAVVVVAQNAPFTNVELPNFWISMAANPAQ